MIYVGLNLRKILYKEPGNILVDHYELISGNLFYILFYLNIMKILYTLITYNLEDTLLYVILQKTSKNISERLFENNEIWIRTNKC